MAVMLLLAVVSLSAPAMASSPHTSSTHTNNGCSWKGYHSYDEVGSGFAHGETWVVSGTCSEVNVKVKVVGQSLRTDYDPSYAVVDFSGTNMNFDYSDHNADPTGPPVYVGFRMY